MFKANKLLRVISILLIVFGALGAVGSIIVLFSGSLANVSVGVGSTVLSVLTAIIEIAIGIVGLKAKQEKMVLIAAIVYLLLTVYGLINTIITIGFTPISLIGFVLPLLYFWGYYQSK